MKLVISFFCLVLSLAGFAHSGHKAYYTIEEEKDQLVLLVKMEIIDIQMELAQNRLSYENLAVDLTQYINDNFSCSVNGKRLEAKFESSYTQKGYVMVKFILHTKPPTMESIRIENNCFKTFGHGYEHIVKLNLEETAVAYKMTAERNRITHTFN